MKQVYFQIKYGKPVALSHEDEEVLKSFKENQIIKADLYGVRKERSVLQNRWIHAIFRIVARNTEDEDWNTPEKVKRNVKLKMKFFKDDVIVSKNKVYFELRSFSFDTMEQDEANVKYEEAKLICAKFLKVSPEKLEANAMDEN